MATSRKFLNLIVDSSSTGAKSLRCIDLTRYCFFNTTPPNGNWDGPETKLLASDDNNKELEDATLKKMKRILLPGPIFNFLAMRPDLNDPWKIDCFPLVDRSVICSNHLGHSFLFEADTRYVLPMPRFHEPKVMPVSLFIPKPHVDNLDGSITLGGSLYVMERIAKPGLSNQFESFVFCCPVISSSIMAWDCQLLPPPPYGLHMCPEITCYTVLGDGSHICISVKDMGTYCLDTTSHTWSQVGNWMLPFYGKVEYVPELKLWFGLSAQAQDMAAADLSSMDSQPQLVGTCKEFDPPEEWKQCKDSQLVNLGSGKFCIARFFHTSTPGDCSGRRQRQDPRSKITAVLTGVEAALLDHDANGDGSLRMIPHNSRYYTSNGSHTIQTVF